VSERRVASATHACPRARARAGHGARKRAPQHACATAVRARPGLGPLFRASSCTPCYPSATPTGRPSALRARNPTNPCMCTLLTSRPGAVEHRRRRGLDAPPSFLLELFVEHLGGGLNPWGRGDLGTPVATRGRGRDRSARTGAARYQIARPHAGLHGCQPHRPLPDRLRLASSWQCRSAGRRDPDRTRDPGIPCG
jgi:hypothetical protein